MVKNHLSIAGPLCWCRMSNTHRYITFDQSYRALSLHGCILDSQHTENIENSHTNSYAGNQFRTSQALCLLLMFATPRAKTSGQQQNIHTRARAQTGRERTHNSSIPSYLFLIKLALHFFHPFLKFALKYRFLRSDDSSAGKKNKNEVKTRDSLRRQAVPLILWLLIF